MHEERRRLGSGGLWVHSPCGLDGKVLGLGFRIQGLGLRVAAPLNLRGSGEGPLIHGRFGFQGVVAQGSEGSLMLALDPKP